MMVSVITNGLSIKDVCQNVTTIDPSTLCPLLSASSHICCPLLSIFWLTSAPPSVWTSFMDDPKGDLTTDVVGSTWLGDGKGLSACKVFQ